MPSPTTFHHFSTAAAGLARHRWGGWAWRWLPRAASAAVLTATLVGALATGVPAQVFSSTAAWRPDPSRPAITGPQDVTFEVMAVAPNAWDYAVDQTRRFLDPRGNLVQIRERLEVRGDFTTESPFKLQFLGLVHGSSDETKVWADVYKAKSGLIHRHMAFVIRDVLAAAANYRLHFYGQHTRIGRPVERVVIFPNQIDKGIWLADLDHATGLPLYRAEFDASGRLLTEIEVTSLSVHGLAAARSVGSGWGWKPRMVVERFPSYGSARMRLTPSPAIQPSVSGTMGEYTPHLVQITTDPLNGDQSLVLGYTDGVDEFFVLQGFDALSPLPVFDPQADQSDGTHAVAAYDDPLVRIYFFHHEGVNYEVMGRGTLQRLGDLSRRLCRQVVTTR